jgi:hypothetical protein
MEANLTSVRLFELTALLLWLAGVDFVRRHPKPLYIGAYAGSTTLACFDWAFNAKWFFNVRYSTHFLPLFRIHGEVQPIALCLTYAFYFGGPLLVAIHYLEAIDRRTGRWGWLAVFLVSGLVNPLFEIPLVHWLHLWTYYQKPDFLLGGVAWSNTWYSGMLFTTCYAAVRVGLRWTAAADRELAIAGRAASPSLPERERWWRDAGLGAAAIWASFYLCMSVQLIWYAIAQPWVSSPRPF